MGLVEQVYFGGRLCDSAKSERERERLFGCLNVLIKVWVYRLRCFKTEILSGGGDVWILYAHNNKTYMYKEDSKKEKKAMLLLLHIYFEIKIDTLMIGARDC